MQDADTRTACLAVEDRLLLSATAPWVACPAALLLPHNGRTFELRVTPAARLQEVVRAKPGLLA